MIESLFGKEFLDYIEVQKSKGKTLEDIAKEHGKTREAIRSKIKREKNKLKNGIVKSTTLTSSTKNTNKIINKNTSKNNTSINTNVVEQKLDFIINLLKNSKEKESTVQNVGQALQLEVQHKNKYVKSSMRVEETVWKEFLTFAKSKSGEYKQQDLISLALLEFLEKYK